MLITKKQTKNTLFWQVQENWSHGKPHIVITYQQLTIQVKCTTLCPCPRNKDQLFKLNKKKKTKQNNLILFTPVKLTYQTGHDYKQSNARLCPNKRKKQQSWTMVTLQEVTCNQKGHIHTNGTC